jgi:hypothetical protein
MTNYCANLIEVEGDAADLRAFRATCISDSGNLDFEAIIPMPNVLRGTHEGIGDIFGVDAELGASALSRAQVDLPLSGRRPPILERESIREAGIRSFEELEAWLRTHRPRAIELGARCLEAYRQTGYLTEHSWQVANWGTHYWEGFAVREETETCLIAEFATAWSPATNIYHEIARRFPTLAITVSAMEEGNELSYRFSSRNGASREEEPGLTTDFVQHIEGRPREIDDFYLVPPELIYEPPTHFVFWAARRRVQRALRGYPVYRPPHNGAEMLMREEHARANFDYFMSQRAARRKALRNFLAPFGVSLEFSDAAKSSLDNWLARYGAFLSVRERGSSYLTYVPHWEGARSGLNVIHDLAVFLGDFACQESVGLSWEMYTDVPTGLQRQDETFQKPVIAGSRSNPRWRFFALTDVRRICEALRERSYMWGRPRMSVSPESLYACFISETLAGVRHQVRDDGTGQKGQ